jgi:hypothetical protein
MDCGEMDVRFLSLKAEKLSLSFLYFYKEITGLRTIAHQ